MVYKSVDTSMAGRHAAGSEKYVSMTLSAATRPDRGVVFDTVTAQRKDSVLACDPVTTFQCLVIPISMSCDSKMFHLKQKKSLKCIYCSE